MTNKPCGLANLGNTCFLNSCVQVFNQIEEIDALIPKCSPHADPKKPDTAVLSEWIQLKRAMIQTNMFVPSKFVKTIHHIAHIKGRDLFTGFAQNDMPEFLLFIIECMHNSVSRGISMRIRGKSENSVDDLAVQCYSMLKTTYEKEYSEFMDLFYGVYVSILSNKTHRSLKPESFFILDLPLSHHTSTIYDAFDLFVAPERLEGENAWLNESTGKKESASKSMVFWSFPKILVIVFKRFSSDGRNKNGALIDFPLTRLDLSKYVVGYNPQSFIYDLVGVCNHMGNVGGGHYTSYYKDAIGQWIHCNDTMVEVVPESRVISPAAYCLFYRKKNKS